MIGKSLMKRTNNNKSGYISIEAVFAMAIFLILFLLSIAFFIYIYPQNQLQSEVEVLAITCERQGGLTQEDIDNFRYSLRKYPYLEGNLDRVTVTADTTSGFDATAVTGLGEDGDNYVKRDSKEIINVMVQIPANNAFIKSFVGFFGVKGVADYYYFFEPVMSERY